MRTRCCTFVCSVLPFLGVIAIHSVWFEQHVELLNGGDQVFGQNTTSSKPEFFVELCITCRFSKPYSYRGSNQMSSVLNSMCIGHILGLLEFTPAVSFS